MKYNIVWSSKTSKITHYREVGKEKTLCSRKVIEREPSPDNWTCLTCIDRIPTLYGR